MRVLVVVLGLFLPCFPAAAQKAPTTSTTLTTSTTSAERAEAHRVLTQLSGSDDNVGSLAITAIIALVSLEEKRAPPREQLLRTADVLMRARNDAKQERAKADLLETAVVLAAVAAGLREAPEAEHPQRVDALAKELGPKGADISKALRAMVCSTRQSEGRGNLKALYVAQESFRAEFDVYDKDLKKLGFQPRGAGRYRFVVEQASDTAFLARAIGTGEAAGDEWTISQNNDLVHVKDNCVK